MEEVMHIRIKKPYANQMLNDLFADGAIEQVEIDLTVSDERLNLIREERASYLKNETASYSWDEVKRMAISKQRPAL